MPTNSEKYGHVTMSNDELEERIAADMYELSNRLGSSSPADHPQTAAIGGLIWKLMGQVREAYRTARMITEGR